MKIRDPVPSADWLAGIFAGSHVAIGVSRLADDRFVAVNEAFLKLFDRNRGEIVGHTALELGIWLNPAEFAKCIAALGRRKTVRSFEAGIRKRSGELGDVQVSAHLFAPEGDDYMVVMLTDITEHKRAERAIAFNKERLETALKLSELVVFHQDRRLRYTWIANPALGATATQIIGRTDDDILGKEAARPLTSIKRRVLRTGQGTRQEVWVTNNGQSGCYDLIVEPERDLEGRTTGLVCVALDVTQRKHAEAHLKLQATIVETLGEGVNLVDAQGILRYSNRKFDAMFGYAPGELLGQPVAVLNADGDSTPEQTAQAIIRTLERVGTWCGDLRNRRKDSSEFWTRNHIVTNDHPLFGRVWISMQSDVTALREAERERDAAQISLGRLANHLNDVTEEQRRQIARDVHDQIGATLTGIRIQLHAAMEGHDDGNMAQLCVLVDQALRNTRTLCTNLRPPMLDDLGLRDTLRWYARTWGRQSGIRIDLRTTALTTEPADPLRIDLFHMLQELLTNVARHASAKHVRVTLRHARDKVMLSVNDDGRGFRTGATGGFGLLGIRERLARYGGLMHIDSTDQGTRVTLTVPHAAP